MPLAALGWDRERGASNDRRRASEHTDLGTLAILENEAADRCLEVRDLDAT